MKEIFTHITSCETGDHFDDQYAGVAMFAAISLMVQRGEIDPRHYAADAALLWRGGESFMQEEEALGLLRETRPRGR